LTSKPRRAAFGRIVIVRRRSRPDCALTATRGRQVAAASSCDKSAENLLTSRGGGAAISTNLHCAHGSLFKFSLQTSHSFTESAPIAKRNMISSPLVTNAIRIAYHEKTLFFLFFFYRAIVLHDSLRAIVAMLDGDVPRRVTSRCGSRSASPTSSRADQFSASDTDKGSSRRASLVLATGGFIDPRWARPDYLRYRQTLRPR